MGKTRRRISWVLSTLLVIGPISGCSSFEATGTACGSYAEETDVKGLTEESEAVVVGSFSEQDADTAEVQVEQTLKGSPESGETIVVSWEGGCGSPTDFVTEPAGNTNVYMFFLIEDEHSYRLFDGAYGMFNTSQNLIDEVSAAVEG